jgi:hypothetical protein
MDRVDDRYWNAVAAEWVNGDRALPFVLAEKWADLMEARIADGGVLPDDVESGWAQATQGGRPPTTFLRSTTEQLLVHTWVLGPYLARTLDRYQGLPTPKSATATISDLAASFSVVSDIWSAGHHGPERLLEWFNHAEKTAHPVAAALAVREFPERGRPLVEPFSAVGRLLAATDRWALGEQLLELALAFAEPSDFARRSAIHNALGDIASSIHGDPQRALRHHHTALVQRQWMLRQADARSRPEIEGLVLESRELLAEHFLQVARGLPRSPGRDATLQGVERELVEVLTARKVRSELLAPETVRTLLNLSDLCRESNDPDSAARSYQYASRAGDVVTQREDLQGATRTNRVLRGLALHHLGATLAMTVGDTGDLGDARHTLETSAATLATALGAESPHTLRTLLKLGRVTIEYDNRLHQQTPWRQRGEQIVADAVKIATRCGIHAVLPGQPRTVGTHGPAGAVALTTVSAAPPHHAVVGPG